MEDQRTEMEEKGGGETEGGRATMPANVIATELESDTSQRLAQEKEEKDEVEIAKESESIQAGKKEVATKQGECKTPAGQRDAQARCLNQETEEIPKEVQDKEDKLDEKEIAGEKEVTMATLEIQKATQAKSTTPTVPADAAVDTSMDYWTRDISPLPTDGAIPRHNTHTTGQPGAFAVAFPRYMESPPTRASAPSTSTDEPEALTCFPATLSPEVQDQEENGSKGDTDSENGTGNPPLPLVEATAMNDDSSKSQQERANRTKCISVITVLLLVAIIVGMSLGLARQGNSQETNVGSPVNTTASSSRLDQIRARGYLRCVYVQMLLFRDNVTGEVGGFNSNWCTAVAAAIWGPDGAKERVQYVNKDLTWHNNDEDTDTVDMSPVGLVASVEHQPYFTEPVFWDGRRVGGERFFVEHCAEQHDFKHIDECQDLKFCAQYQSSNLPSSSVAIWEGLPPRKIVVKKTNVEVVLGFLAGECNLFFVSRASLPDSAMKLFFGYQGDYVSSETIFGKVGFTIVASRSSLGDAEDAHWTDFVTAVFQSLLVANQHNITQTTWDQFPQTDLFGEDYKDMFRHAVKAVGNYGEIYRKFIGPERHLTQMNSLNNGTTGLIQSRDPTEIISLELADKPDRQLGKNLHKVLTRGRLLCGVSFGRPGFQEMEVDYCRVLAAALFAGDGQAVDLVEVQEGNGFDQLASGKIDVLTGAAWNLPNSIQEPTTQQGFALTRPYFYRNDANQGHLCLATLQDDNDWASFVYWVVSATMYAEMVNVTAQDSHNMPLTNAYGFGLRRMLRDAVLQSSNYGGIYARNMESVIPREGRNMLDSSTDTVPQHLAMPGLM